MMNVIERAQQHLYEVCKDSKKFRMSVPARSDDSDFVFQAVIDLARNQAKETGKELRNMIDIQRDCLGGCEYMRGMLNGLICAWSVVTGKKPDFEEAPSAETSPKPAKMGDEELALEIISELDGIARDHDGFDYGLPMFDEEVAARMKLAVVQLLANRESLPKAAPDVSGEKAKALKAFLQAHEHVEPPSVNEWRRLKSLAKLALDEMDVNRESTTCGTVPDIDELVNAIEFYADANNYLAPLGEKFGRPCFVFEKSVVIQDEGDRARAVRDIARGLKVAVISGSSKGMKPFYEIALERSNKQIATLQAENEKLKGENEEMEFRLKGLEK